MSISIQLPANQAIEVPSSFIAGLSWPAWIFDQQTLSFVDVNDAALRQYGFSRVQFLQLTLLDIRPLTEVPKIIHRTLDQEHCGPSREERWLHRRRDGSSFAVRITSCYVRVCGRPAELVIAIPQGEQVVEDLPQQKKPGKVQHTLGRFRTAR
jgi:PAS domain S-box-containing protein